MTPVTLHTSQTRAIFLGIGLLMVAGPASAIELDLPIACEIGRDCRIQAYVDRDPGPGATDYHCGPLTYDGHNGVDFRLPSFADLDADVSVRAAADGVVALRRDGLPDVHVALVGEEAITREGLGNMVVLDHGDGWTTEYGHMRRRSIAVAPGENVARGQALGLVGLSGLTSFPHLHFAARHRGTVVDPFTGPDSSGCGGVGVPLWSASAMARLAYEPTFLIGMGFADHLLTREAAQYGLPRPVTLNARSGALVVWAFVAELYRGDRLELRLIDPAGEVRFTHEETLEKNAMVAFRSGGRRRPAEAWPIGTYRAEVHVLRQVDGATGVALEAGRSLELTVPEQR